MKKTILILIIVIMAAVIAFLAWPEPKMNPPVIDEPMVIEPIVEDQILVTSFEECVAAGNAVMESYPRQCIAGGVNYTEDIGGDLEKADLIRINSPRPNSEISSPLMISGEARGNWFFEASFPVFLTDWDGRIIAEGIANAQADWMTTDFVPFDLTLNFSPDEQVYSNRGTLIFKKDNPSGLPEFDDALEIPVIIN
ncbi:MAG: Gmad2 immunoglobulin-like domain-containing protein [Patescibacteria group bacterium]|nr:Gmad2 immunoglobulin-like domain-containing protein [Patescibacteria group bacterium]